MTRDYKHRKRPAKRGTGSQQTFAAGLAIGLAVAVLVHLYHVSGKKPAVDQDDFPSPKPAARESTAEDDIESRFSFYDILPEFEVLVPAESPPEPGQPASMGQLQPGTYYLQAGSFRNHADADRRKATLALLGVTASIQRVTINDDQTWHRVRIGPIRDPEELKRLQARLGDEKIQTMPVRAVEAP